VESVQGDTRLLCASTECIRRPIYAKQGPIQTQTADLRCLCARSMEPFVIGVALQQNSLSMSAFKEKLKRISLSNYERHPVQL